MTGPEPAHPEVPGCPRCSTPLLAAVDACPACGLRLVGHDAAALWQLDQQLAAMQRRRAELIGALAGPAAPRAPAAPAAPAGPAEAPAAPAPVPVPPSDAWTAPDAPRRGPVTAPVPPAPPVPPVPPAGVTAPPSDPYGAPTTRPVPTAPGAGEAPDDAPRTPRRLRTQQLLLVTGVLLVAVAAGTWTAVRWDAIGALGQAAVLVLVCAGAAVGARACARRGLGASAEALAVLAVAVLLVLLAAARSLDVLGLGATDRDAYQLGALLVAVALAAAGDRWLRRGEHPRALAWSAVLLTAAVPAALVAAVDGELLTWAAAALVLSVASVPATRPLRRRAPGLGAAGLVVGAAHLVLGVLSLLVVDVTADDGSWDPVLAALQFTLLAVVAGRTAAAAGRPAGQDGPGLLAGRPQVRLVAVVVAYAGVVGALVSLAAAGGPFAMLLLALGVSAAAAALLAARPAAVPWPVLAAALALAAGALVAEPVVGSTEGTWWRPTAWCALALAAALAGARRPVPSAPSVAWSAVREVRGARAPFEVPRALWAAAASAAAVVSTLLVPAPWGRPAAVVLAVVVGALLLAASAAVRGPAEHVLTCGWAAAVLSGTLVAPEGPVSAAVPLAVAGVGALLRAGDADRTAWVLPGTALLAAAWWTEASSVAPPDAGVEWWTAPPALLALAVGALAWQRHPALGSWPVLGPGLAVGLLPPALQAALESGLLADAGTGWRVGVVAVAGAAACALGVRRSWQAPVVLGAVALVVVAVGQLGPYALLLPASVGLFAAGAVVIVLAVRIEQARRDAARAVGWVRALR